MVIANVEDVTVATHHVAYLLKCKVGDEPALRVVFLDGVESLLVKCGTVDNQESNYRRFIKAMQGIPQ